VSSKFPRPKPAPPAPPSVAERTGATGVLDERRLSQGKWNYYRCERCRAIYVTVDLHHGTTPAFLRCKDRPIIEDGRASRMSDCPGRMVSAWYPWPSQWPEIVPKRADGEWFRPSRAERAVLKKRNPAMYAHVMAGGLMLQPPTITHEFPTEG
jgi:hypothetical protein